MSPCGGFPPEDYALYVLGSLSEPASEQIRAHLARNCETCRREVRESQDLWYEVALSTPQASPPRSLRRRILQTAGAPESATGLRWLYGLVTAGLVAAAAFTGWIVAPARVPAVQTTHVLVPTPPDISALHRLEEENDRLRSQVARVAAVPALPAAPAPASVHTPDTESIALRAQIAAAQRDIDAERSRATRLESELTAARQAVAAAHETPRPDDSAALGTQLASLQTRTQQLERQLAEYKTLLADANRRLESTLQLASLLNSPELTLVRLRGTEAGHAVEGRALVAAGSRVVFTGSRLPALPAGRVYQLWLIRSQSPAIVSAGTFNSTKATSAELQFSSGPLTRGVTAIAVTEEPAGGSEKPTGHKILVGQVS